MTGQNHYSRFPFMNNVMLPVFKNMPPWNFVTACSEYMIDLAQRQALFLDVMRKRGNGFVEMERKGLVPVLAFDYDIVVDGRTLEKPVNYALVQIRQPA